MRANCERHPFEFSADICDSCGHDYCTDCLLFARGPKKPPFCASCALVAAGVRPPSALPPIKFSKRDIKRVRKERRQREAEQEPGAEQPAPPQPAGPAPDLAPAQPVGSRPSGRQGPVIEPLARPDDGWDDGTDWDRRDGWGEGPGGNGEEARDPTASRAGS